MLVSICLWGLGVLTPHWSRAIHDDVDKFGLGAVSLRRFIKISSNTSVGMTVESRLTRVLRCSVIWISGKVSRILYILYILLYILYIFMRNNYFYGYLSPELLFYCESVIKSTMVFWRPSLDGALDSSPISALLACGSNLGLTTDDDLSLPWIGYSF